MESVALDHRRVVIVDDTDDVRLMLRIMLERDGRFEIVGEAEDGRSGIAAVRALQPDLVVLDLGMPEMDGLQALPLIRACSPGTRVVVFSAFRADVARSQVLAAGAAQYAEKGMPLRELVTLLHDTVTVGAA